MVDYDVLDIVVVGVSEDCFGYVVFSFECG